MTRRLIFIFGVASIVFLIGLAGFLWLRSGSQKTIDREAVSQSPTTPAPRLSPATTVTPTISVSPVAGKKTTAAVDWAKSLLSRYPYKKDNLSGVLPAKREDEVWVVGFKIGSGGFYPTNQQGQQYAGVKNNYGDFQAKLADDALYTIQKGDDLTQTATATSPATIKDGDLVAARMTFADNFGLILEIRRLLTPY